MDRPSYSGSSKTRPLKNQSGGYGGYCCIPCCKSAFYDSNRQKTGISLFQVPSKDPQRKQWIKIISNFRRTGGADRWNTKKKILICEFHFRPEDIYVTRGSGKKS